MFLRWRISTWKREKRFGVRTERGRADIKPARTALAYPIPYPFTRSPVALQQRSYESSLACVAGGRAGGLAGILGRGRRVLD